MFLNWLLDQPAETPLKYIKDLAKEQFQYLDEIEKKIINNKQAIQSESSKIIEDLRTENKKLSEKMAQSVQEVVHSLKKKLEDTENELETCKKSLSIEIVIYNKEESQIIGHKLKEYNKIIKTKEQEIVEYKENHEVLEEKIQELKQQIEDKKMINLLPIKEISENSEKAFEGLMRQVKDLEEENIKLKNISEIYEFEIKNLQKVNAEKVKSKNIMFSNAFSGKSMSTQTVVYEDLGSEWMKISFCLASALEDALKC